MGYTFGQQILVTMLVVSTASTAASTVVRADGLRSVQDGAGLIIAERIAGYLHDDQFLVGLVSGDLAVPDDLVEAAW